jgi:hypothetical protein
MGYLFQTFAEQKLLNNSLMNIVTLLLTTYCLKWFHGEWYQTNFFSKRLNKFSHKQ